MLNVKRKTMLLAACAVSAPAALLQCGDHVCNGFCGSVPVEAATPDAQSDGPSGSDAPSDAPAETEQ